MAESQIYFEDLEEGMDLPEKSWGPITTVDMVRFGSAVDSYGKLHQDYFWCIEHGFQDILISGPMKQALLSSWLDQIAGDSGFVKKMSVQHRGMDYVDKRILTASGKVTSINEQSGLGYVECDIKLANSDGQVTCPGRATIIFPKRGSGPVPVEYATPPALAAFIEQILGAKE